MELGGVASVWVLSATALVFVMQVGFCFLEVGFVRAKNSVNVAIKNVMDFCVAGFLFWVFGYGIMFGESFAGLIGTSGFMPDQGGSDDLLFVLFQLMFCGTATTIVSGAVAERMGYSSYVAVSALLSGLVYPVFGHWAWGGMAGDGPAGWLARLGFIDFAGSTVVHSVGGWMSLAAILVIGPRRGRFGPRPVAMTGHNLSMAAGGTLLLWLGWIGFNGGSALGDLEIVPAVILHTMIAACAGGLAGHVLSLALHRRARVEHLLNGVLGGLVAITACCHVVGGLSAILVGAVGGGLALLGEKLLLRLGIDDAVGAVPVHLFAGIWGTLAVALLGDPQRWGTGHDLAGQLAVQALGVAACGVYAFGVGILALALADRLHPLRISEAQEEIGLNVAEHEASSPMLDLIREMERQRMEGRFDRPVPVEPESDVEPIATAYNRVIDRVGETMRRQDRLLQELSSAKLEAEASNQAKSRFLASMSHELRTPLNAVIGFSQLIAEKAYGPVSDQYAEYARDINESGHHLLTLVNDVLDYSRIEAGKAALNEQQVDLGRVAALVQRMMQATADAAGVGLACDMPRPPPPLLADERAIRQILINLASNAIKFTRSGGTVTLSAAVEPDRRILLSVVDTGIGMDPAAVPRALEPFSQLHGDLSRSHAGAGLGLSLVKALAQLHGATLVIRTAPGQGTAVHIRFPAERTLTPP